MTALKSTAMKVQEIWNAFDLQGALGLIEVVFEGGSPPQLSVALEDVNLIIKEARARRICDTSAACVALSTLPSCTTLSGH